MAKIKVTSYEDEKKSKAPKVHLELEKNTGNSFGYIAGRLGTGIASVFEGTGKLLEGTAALLSGEENYAKYVFTKSKVGEWREELEKDYNPGGFMSFLGDVGEGIGQSSVMLANAAVPFLGTGTFFSGIAGNSVGNAVQQTGELGFKEYGYGLTLAGAEAMMESIIGAGGQIAKKIGTTGTKAIAKSVGKATVQRAARNGILKNVLLEGSGEFMEEFLGDFVDVTAQKLFGINKDAQYSLQNALYSGLVGFVSGSAMGAGTHGIQAATYYNAGQRVQRNGNAQTLLRQAKAVEENFSTMGGEGIFSDRKKMDGYITAIQGSYNAYNALFEEAKAGVKGAIYLGEIQGAMAALQNAQGVAVSKAKILQKAEKFADYASKSSGKAYSANDVAANKDGILDALAVEHFTGSLLSPSEAEKFEMGIREVIRREGAEEAEERRVFEEMDFDPATVRLTPESVSHDEAVTMIADSESWDGQSDMFYKVPGEGYIYVRNHGDGSYTIGEGSAEEYQTGKIRMAKATVAEVREALRRERENAQAVEEVAEDEETEVEESQTSVEATVAEASEEVAAGEEVKNSLPKKQNKKKESVRQPTEEEIAKDKAKQERAKIQDRARAAVPAFDQQPVDVRNAIEAMYRSAKENGVSNAAADAAAHLIAVLGGTEIRFQKGITKNGVNDFITDTDGNKRRLLLINPKTDAEGGATTTLLHEVTHSLEKMEGYKELSEIALEAYPEEKAEEIRSRYRNYAEKHGMNFSDEYIDQEVVAEAVGVLLTKGKYIARLSNRSTIVNGITMLGRIAQSLVGKNRATFIAARKLWIAFHKCLATNAVEARRVYSSIALDDDGQEKIFGESEELSEATSSDHDTTEDKPSKPIKEKRNRTKALSKKNRKDRTTEDMYILVREMEKEFPSLELTVHLQRKLQRGEALTKQEMEEAFEWLDFSDGEFERDTPVSPEFEVLQAKRKYAGTAVGEGDLGSGKTVRYSFAGIKAKNADIMKLATAKEMLANGTDEETVRKETGWFKGYDDKWRFEIDDFDSSLIEKPNLQKHEEDGEVYFTGTLSDIVAHPMLFSAYPQLKDINIVIQKTALGVEGIYQPKSNYITLSRDHFKRYTKAYYDYLNGGRKTEIEQIEQTPEFLEYNKWYDDEIADNMEPLEWLEAEREARQKFFSSALGKRYHQLKYSKDGFMGEKFELGWGTGAKAVIMHELQHAIQRIEGFATGANTSNKDYSRVAGEIESRDVEKRLDLTADQRKNTRPDIDRTDMVFANKGGVSYSEGDGAVIELTENSELSSRLVGLSGAKKYKAIKEYLIEHFYGREFTLSDGISAIMDKSDAKELSHKANEKRTAELAELDKIIETADLTAYVENADHDKFVAFRYYSSKVSYQGDVFEIILNVGLGRVDSRYHIYAITENKKSRTADPQTGLSGLSQSERHRIQNDSAIDSIPHESDSVNSESKKYSLQKADADYTSAVNNGDMVTAQRMVDEAAECSMPNTVVRDENHKLLPMYHGTGYGGFTVFSDYYWRFGLFGMGFYFTADREVASSYQQKGKGDRWQIYTVYLDISNPIDMDAVADLPKWREAIPEAEEYFDGCKTNENCFRALREYCHDELMENWEMGYLIVDVIREMGYDGITHIGGGRFNKKDGNRHRVYIAFESEQIKSADTVTYDSDGKMVPLSMRFDKENNDIRYSIPADVQESIRERDEKLEQEVKRQKSRADRLQDELHAINEYGYNAGDVYAIENDRSKEYNGKMSKDVRRRMLLKITNGIAYLRKYRNAENAVSIERNIDRAIRDYAEEVIYNRKEEVDPELKAMRSHMRDYRISISEGLKGDLDRFDGYESFRRRNMGRGLILSKEGTPVETIYPELTATFGEAAFPSSVKNPVDQLIQISETLKSGIKNEDHVDYDELVRAEERLLRSLLTDVVKKAKGSNSYNPLYNERMAEGYTGAVTTYYAPDGARKILRAGESVIDQWAEKNRAIKRRVVGMREKLENEFLYLLNAAKADERRDAAERLAVDLINAHEFLVGAKKIEKTNKNGKPYSVWEGGTKYTAKSLPDADAYDLFEELTEEILNRANSEQYRVDGIVYAGNLSEENAALREEVESLKVQAELASQIKSLRDYAKGKTKPSDKVDFDDLNAVLDEFSKIVQKGRISPEKAQKFALWFENYLNTDTPTGTILYLREHVSAAVRENLKTFGTLNVEEPSVLDRFYLKVFTDLFYEMRRAYENYGMVKMDGQWKYAIDIAQNGVRQANGSLLHVNRRKGFSKFTQPVKKFLLQAQDPLRTAMLLEGYADGGVLSKLIYDVIIAEAERTSMEMEFLKKFEDFFKEHKGYQQKLATKMLEVKAFEVTKGDERVPFEMTLGEAMSFIALSKREQAQDGLANSDIFFENDDEGTRMVEGGWKRWADMDAGQRISALTGGVSELMKQLEQEDLEFFGMVEEFFNKESSAVKRRSDVDYFGHEMTMEEYYFPIYRDRSTISDEIADANKRMQNFITVSNQSFNKATLKNAQKSLFIGNVYDIVTRHASGLATYATLYRPVLNFNTIWNQQTSGNKNHPESMRSVYKQNVWDGIDAYIRNLFDTVQGIRQQKGVLSKIISTVRGNAVFYQLGLNPKTWLTQTTSLIASTDVLTMDAVSYGIAHGRPANDEAMDKYSVFARTRDYNMEVAKAEGLVDKIHKYGEFTMKPISMMDRAVVRMLWAGCQKQVMERDGHSIGSEENNVAAGKLLDEVILRTQQTAGAATKSGLQRGSELEKSLVMFSSDAVKLLSSLTERIMRNRKYRVDAKNGVEGAVEKLADSNLALTKTAASALGVAVVSAMIAQVFKYIYDRDRRKKKDGTEVSAVSDIAIDSFGNLVGIIPIVRELYDMLDSGYEVTDFTLDAFNEIIKGYTLVLDTVSSAIGGEYVPSEDIWNSVRQAFYSTGMMFGIPVRNANNMFDGFVLNMGIDKVAGTDFHWQYQALFNKPSYSKELNSAIEQGDAALAELILATWLEREKVGTVGDELDVIMELYENDYDILPASAPSKLDRANRTEWMNSMQEIQQQAAEMILSDTWQSMSMDAKAATLKNLYSNRQSNLKTRLLGEDRTKGGLLAEMYGDVPVAEIRGLASATETYEDENGNKVTKKEQLEESLSRYDGDEAIIWYLAGYSSQEAKRILAEQISRIATTEEEKQELYNLLGINIEDL